MLNNVACFIIYVYFWEWKIEIIQKVSCDRTRRDKKKTHTWMGIHFNRRAR